MSFGAYLLVMAMGTGLSWTAWYIVLNNVNPDESGPIGFAMFYVTLFVALIGTLGLIELLVRKAFKGSHPIPGRDVRMSFRRGVLLALVTTLSLFLTAQGLFMWWVLLLLAAAAGILEYIALVVEGSRRG